MRKLYLVNTTNLQGEPLNVSTLRENVGGFLVGTGAFICNTRLIDEDSVVNSYKEKGIRLDITPLSFEELYQWKSSGVVEFAEGNWK